MSHQQARKLGYLPSSPPSLDECCSWGLKTTWHFYPASCVDGTHSCIQRDPLERRECLSERCPPKLLWPPGWTERMWLGHQQHLLKVGKREWNQIANSLYPVTSDPRIRHFCRANVFFLLMDMATDWYYISDSSWSSCPRSLPKCKLDFRTSSEQEG